jgi:hypothetical protein
MRCGQAKKLLFNHIDGVISESDRVGLESHLAVCRSCEEMASALSRSLELIHRLPSELPSENFNWKLRLRLAKAKQAWRDTADEGAWQKVWTTRFALGAVTAFATVLVGGGVLVMSGGEHGNAVDRFARVTEPAAPASGGPGERREEGPSWAYTPFASPGSDGFVSRPVATGGTPGWDGVGNARSSGPLIDVDSLRVRYMESRIEYRRMKSLEQQIEILHDELEKCTPTRDR